ncbi:MAG TPA: hypothetical protein VNK43_04560 [Gemmatimonadales bacterium]|nr:hypothetical protein [Gemmatimonadales bacterium]
MTHRLPLAGLAPAPLALAIAAAIARAFAPEPARAQDGVAATRPQPLGRDTVVLAAGPRYAASGLHRFLFGTHHRRLWATPIRVPVLDLRRFDGGLRPTEAGGGMQTKSLRFVSRRGLEYVFRTVDKDPSSLLPEALRGTVVDRIFQDQISSAHPAGGIVAAALLDAVGILHPTPRFAVMPDDPRLGEHRADFAGKLGTFEEYPNERAGDRPGFAGAGKVIGSDELLGKLNEDPDHRVDAGEFLAARLVDFLLNDWDRHEDQWRWAAFADDPRVRWRPVPRDRDQALVWFDGFLPSLARFAYPKLVGFDESFPSLDGLTLNSRHLDRRLLAPLERPAWDSITRRVQARITDSVIAAAIGRMPPEYQALQGDDLAAKLARRRDRLHEISARFYGMLARVVDLHGTDAADSAVIRRHADGSVEIALHERGGDDGTDDDGDEEEPGRDERVVATRLLDTVPAAGAGYRETAEADRAYFRRRFRPDETREIRLYLHGAHDRAIVLGSAPRSITVRVIGGLGDDRLLDASRVGGATGPTRFYDLGAAGPIHSPDSLYGPDTLFDRRPWHLGDHDTLVPPEVDYGSGLTPQLAIGYDGDLGFVVGAGAALVRRGFLTRPHAARYAVDAAFATGPDAFRLVAEAELRREASRWGMVVRAQTPEFGVLRFYGLGNETPSRGPKEYHRVDQEQYALEPALALALPHEGRASLGPVIQYTTGPPNAGRLIAAARPYGFRHFGQVGIRARLRLEPSDHDGLAQRGIKLRASASLFPPFWDVAETFGAIDAEAVYHVRTGLLLRPVLALRAGGRRVWGTYPVHEAAFIGGSSTVRGLREQRFAGDASLYGGAELRVRLGRVRLILPGNVGVFALVDAGRVFLEGESSRRWHATAGGGVWLSVLETGSGLGVALAEGEDGSQLYIGGGFAY